MYLQGLSLVSMFLSGMAIGIMYSGKYMISNK